MNKSLDRERCFIQGQIQEGRGGGVKMFKNKQSCRPFEPYVLARQRGGGNRPCGTLPPIRCHLHLYLQKYYSHDNRPRLKSSMSVAIVFLSTRFEWIDSLKYNKRFQQFNICYRLFFKMTCHNVGILNPRKKGSFITWCYRLFIYHSRCHFLA